MGHDKALLEIAGKTFLQRAAHALSVTCHRVLISTGQQPGSYGFPEFAEILDSPSYAGPLAGMLAGFDCCREDWLLVVPCDLPLLTPEYGSRLQQSLAGGGILAVATAGGQTHFACLLAHGCLAASLQNYLGQGARRVEPWVLQHHPTIVDFSDLPHLLLNVNTPDALERARQLAEQPSGTAPERS
jgi:molybdopterin-guanine dinucleotide biosynthesis protein A